VITPLITSFVKSAHTSLFTNTRSMCAQRAACPNRRRLKVHGIVERELSLSLEELRALPARTQITRHDCVEGWSCIAKWTGVPLGEILSRTGVKPEARFVVFHCADTLDDGGDSGSDPESIRYYESIDLIDAEHPQTILAYEMNGEPLTVRHGAPLRLRLERQLGYKMAKYIMRIELVQSFTYLHGGRGGYWEDRGYEWYAGIWVFPLDPSEVSMNLNGKTYASSLRLPARRQAGLCVQIDHYASPYLTV